MTCKDCLLRPMCFVVRDIGEKDRYAEACKHFKNKSDYAEVKHGEWKPIVKQDNYLEPPYCDTIKCSVCGEEADVSFHDAKYCYACGAKMDGRSDT